METTVLEKPKAADKPFEFHQDYDNYDGMFSYKNDKTLKRYHELWKSLQEADLSKFDMFAAFSKEQFEKGLKSIRPLNDGEKLCSLGAGIFGTKDGIKKYLNLIKVTHKKIAEECDPQEVYVYEFNNFESAIAFDGDENAIKIVADIFGIDTARKVKRRCAYYSLDNYGKEK